MRVSGTQEVVNDLKKIPAEKWPWKLGKSLFGILIVYLTVYKLEFKQEYEIGLIALGGFFISQDLVTKFLKLIPGVVVDIVSAVRGNKSEK